MNEPTSPPPFGRPSTHIGGSYDWWWWNFGKEAGIPYNPSTPPRQETPVMLGDAPVVGFGEVGAVPPAVVAPSPWTVALVTSALGAATGWALEEVAQRVRRRRRR